MLSASCKLFVIVERIRCRPTDKLTDDEERANGSRYGTTACPRSPDATGTPRLHGNAVNL